MSGDTRELKANLRRTLRAESKRFSASERATASAQLCQRLKEQAIWERARSILFYFPMPDEPDIQPLFAEAMAAGKTVALPRYSAGAQHYEACPEVDLQAYLKLE